MIDNKSVLALAWLNVWFREGWRWERGWGAAWVDFLVCSSGVGNEMHMNSDMYKLRRYRICSALEVYAAVLLLYFLTSGHVMDQPAQFISILPSPSKWLGHFSVSSPSQCWCTRFGELSAINNIPRTGRDGPELKKESFRWKCPNYFCLRLYM